MARPNIMIVFSVSALTGVIAVQWALPWPSSPAEPVITNPQVLQQVELTTDSVPFQHSRKPRHFIDYAMQHLPSDSSLTLNRQSNAEIDFDVVSATLLDEWLSPTPINQLLTDAGIRLAGLDDSSNHDAALFQTLFEPYSTNTDAALDIIVKDWLQHDPAAAWWWITTNDATGVLEQYRRGIAESWLNIDADAALLAIAGLPTSPSKQQMIADYAAHLAIAEPERAFYWAYELTDNNERREALDKVVYQWASSDPEQVIAHLENIPEPALREQLLFQTGPTITAQLTQLDPQQAMLWAASLNENENKFLTPIAFQQWVNKNPEQALNWLRAEKNPTQSELYLSSVSGTLAYQDLSLAIDLYKSQNEQVQQNMSSSIAFGLYQQNPDEASLWTNNLSDRLAQLNAHRGMLLASVDNEPEIALQMAIDYQGQDQTDVLVNTAMQVDQQHPLLLERWLPTAPLTDSQQTNILEALVRSPNY